MFLKQYSPFSADTRAFSRIFTLSLILNFLIFLPACKVKEGCPGMNQHVKAGKDGKLPSKPGKGKSSLFPRGM
jgi:hypothetical protein